MDKRAMFTTAAALCSAGAAAIHFGVTQEHFAEWWLYGVFFLLCAAWQAVWAVLAWRRPTTRLLVVGAVTNVAFALLWAETRIFGLPFGPDAGDVESVGVTDVVCTALEAVVVVAVGLVLLVRRVDAPPVSPRRLAIGTTAGIAVFVLLTSGVALAAPQEHSHGASADEKHGHGKKHKEPNLPDLSKATAQDTAKAKKLLADSIADTRKFRDTDAAKAAGYDVDAALKRWWKKHQRAGDSASIPALHVGDKKAREDGKTADPAAPETVIYRRGDDGKLALVGVMYRFDGTGDPPAVAGPYTRWHTHQHCVGRGQKRAGAVHEHDAACPSGTKRKESAAMTHVWFVKESQLRRAYARRPPVAAVKAYQESLS